MDSWKIRPAQLADIDAVLGVNKEAQSSALPQGWLTESSLHAEARRLFLVAESAEGLIDAFCLASLVLDEASLLLIAVRSGVRGKGVGGALLRALLDSLAAVAVNRCLLEVRKSNMSALALYQSCGFTRDGCRRGYYPSEASEKREDAILMSWTRKAEDHGSA